MISLVFFLVGFGIMFGQSDNGFFGTGLLLLDGVDQNEEAPLGFIFFMFQLAFVATAATIVSGAMSERTGLVSYLVGSFVIGLIIYPVYGFWAWGNLFYGDNKPWLAEMGFMDFAGSTVVHSVGGWIALVGCLFIGPRLGRYDAEGNVRPMESFSIAWSALGVFILWFGWWGFNGGSTLTLDSTVGPILANTNIAAAAAGLSAFVHCFVFQNRNGMYEKFMGGILGGLVAITACCNVVTPLGALIVGASAGVIHNLSFDFMQKVLKVDDPVGAIPVHLVCGIWGTLCVALFGQQEMLGLPRWEQLGVQAVGIGACAVWTCTTAYIMFKLLKTFVGLRVSPQEEKDGIQIERRTKERVENDRNEKKGGEEPEMSEEELIKLMGEM